MAATQIKAIHCDADGYGYLQQQRERMPMRPTEPHHIVPLPPLSLSNLLNLEKLQLARRNMNRPCHCS